MNHTVRAQLTVATKAEISGRKTVVMPVTDQSGSEIAHISVTRFGDVSNKFMFRLIASIAANMNQFYNPAPFAVKNWQTSSNWGVIAEEADKEVYQDGSQMIEMINWRKEDMRYIIEINEQDRIELKESFFCGQLELFFGK